MSCPRCGGYLFVGDSFCRSCGHGPLDAQRQTEVQLTASPSLPSAERTRPVPVSTEDERPPGWYPDPHGQAVLRYWNGRSWTPHRANPRPSGPPLRGAPSSLSGAPEGPGLPGLGLAMLGFVVGAGASFLVLLALRAAGRPGGVAVALTLSELALWAGLLTPVVWVSCRRGTGRLSADFGWTVRPVDVGIGTLGAVVGRAAGLVAVLPLVPAFHELMRHPEIGPSQNQIRGGTWVVYGLIVCVGAPVVEELFFRGLVQTRLVGRWGAGRGIAATSVLFGAAHLIGWRSLASLLVAVAITAGGAVLGFLRYRTGRLGTSTVAHAVFNAMSFALQAGGVG